MNALARNILATVAYYDAMDYPLTLFEVWRYLTFEDVNAPAQYRTPQSLGAVDSALQALVRDGRLVCVDGWYVLPTRMAIVAQRRRRERLSVAKLRAMRRAVVLLRFVPYVRMVWVTGRLAMKYAQPGSDWDVLIVLARGRIWSGRLLVTLAALLTGRRKSDRRHADRLCLNYFVTTASMAISLDDRFSAHEYMMARPLFASVRPQKFLAANAWIRRFRPHYDTLVLPSAYTVRDTAVAHALRRAGERVLDVLGPEGLLRRLQRAKIMRNPKTFRRGSMIIANDNELVFLPVPHSPRVLAAYHERCRAQGLRACA